MVRRRPAVWALCLAFFQTTLFAGYAYAHCLIRYAPARRQLAWHALACAVGLASLPVLPGDAWKPVRGVEPSGAILAMLFVHVAAPFAVLAATGPLVQAWFARGFPTRSPYPLYAVSNLGSLLALVAYPFVVEPNLRLSTTGTAWSWAFAATAVAVLGCAAMARRASGVLPAALTEVPTPDLPPATARRVLWVLLAGCAVVLLMGVTNKLCLDLASVPFLWVLPLATYLISLILCFGSGRIYRRVPFVALTALAYFASPLAEYRPIDVFPPVWSVQFQTVRYCVLLFGACMVLHGELYRLRPAATSLTSFYLCVSGGGAVGGILVALVAPRILDDYYELGAGIAFAVVLLLAACWNDSRGWLRRGARHWPWRWAAVTTLGVGLVWFERPRVQEADRDLLYHERTFFGMLRVRELTQSGRQHQLMNGTTLHGIQFQGNKEVPTSYYGRQTGIGLALALRGPDLPSSIGVVGLGAGTLAAYGRPGDRIRFYEIDPAVIRLAHNASWFSFLSDSRAEVEVVEGDARISLSADREANLPPFDFLIVDAYSSDAVPVHLMTREAIALYLASITETGLLAMHASSRFFRLEPLLARFAQDAGVGVLAIQNPQLPTAQSGASLWVFLSRSEDRLRDLQRLAEQRSRVFANVPGLFRIGRPSQSEVDQAPLWTDDFSDLFGVLKPLDVTRPLGPS